MAILRPPDEMVRQLPPETPIMVDSDADSNARAIQEIERWCRSLGLIRAQESCLRTLTLDGKVVRRAVCYRPSPAWSSQQRDSFEATVARVDASPLTVASAEIGRQA